MNTSCKYLVGFILIRIRTFSFCMSFGICRHDPMPTQATTINRGWT
jgi:hypothetical protein